MITEDCFELLPNPQSPPLADFKYKYEDNAMKLTKYFPNEERYKRFIRKLKKKGVKV